jgi:hypothetical protein
MYKGQMVYHQRVWVAFAKIGDYVQAKEGRLNCVDKSRFIFLPARWGFLTRSEDLFIRSLEYNSTDVIAIRPELEVPCQLIFSEQVAVAAVNENDDIQPLRKI